MVNWLYVNFLRCFFLFYFDIIIIIIIILLPHPSFLHHLLDWIISSSLTEFFFPIAFFPVLQEGAFALVFKSRHFPGEAVATRLVCTLWRTLSHTLSFTHTAQEYEPDSLGVTHSCCYHNKAIQYDFRRLLRFICCGLSELTFTMTGLWNFLCL